MPNVLKSSIALLPVIVVLLAGVLFLIYRSSGEEVPSDIGARASAALVSQEGEPVGSVAFTQTTSGVLVAAEVDRLSPGGHAFIIHSVGACTPDFDAAGDHFNPEDVEHGFVHSNWRDSSGAAHGGDLPNIYAAADGSARADFLTDGVTLDTGKDHSLFDDDGSSIIVHEKPDTYGEREADTGSRVACGVIERNR